MAKSYIDDDGTIAVLLAKVMKAHHPDLVEHGVTVAILLAHDSKDSPLKQRGYPCLAIIKVVSLENRLKGVADALLKIDSIYWDQLPDDQRKALLDHELTHLKVQKDKRGEVKRDDAGRPKLKTRLHDHECGTFWEVAERHKEAAIEVLSLGAAVKKLVQLEIPWDY